MSTLNWHGDEPPTIVVAGATGGVGEGITRQLLDRGARVVALGRDSGRLDQLSDRLRDNGPGTLVPVVVDISAPNPAKTTARLRTEVPSADGAIIAIGMPGSFSGTTVLDITDEDAEPMIAVNQVGGLHALQALVPLVHPGGAVVNLLGYSAEVPFPGNPMMASTSAALRSLITTLALQLGPTGPRIYGLVLGVVRTLARQKAGIDNPHWLTGDQVGGYAADLISGQVERPDQCLRYFLSPSTGPSLTPPDAA
ncbi:SDR family oxidoreductase [Streptomyces sp. NBC_01356]|uniref:SDR family NAD(P)-dependent oxidoreductase n=1 Tax=Streptomyces sp. NBC_01356 TaxID=2903836 RepID=UPI002E37AC4E|nr:SDR family oxidoreductase [Streptomyces sp. NBC_01356]